MSRVRFIDYTGEYPNFCSGELKLWIDEAYITLPSGASESGGEVDLCDDNIVRAPWKVNLPTFLEPYRAEIERCVNNNVEFGCCGGCI